MTLSLSVSYFFVLSLNTLLVSFLVTSSFAWSADAAIKSRTSKNVQYVSPLYSSSIIDEQQQQQQRQQQTNKDYEFHSWCHSVGIQIHPYVQLQTTSRSVAGRGVFATEDLKEGEVVLVIPEPCVLHEHNAAIYFPQVANQIQQERRQGASTLSTSTTTTNADSEEQTMGVSWWKRPFQKIVRRQKRRRMNNHNNDRDEFRVDSSDCMWQAELTVYAMACLYDEHPWKTWILQWQRDDIVYDLFQQNIQWNDESKITQASHKLHEQLPDASYYKIRAAVQLRLKRYYDLQQIYTSLFQQQQPPPQIKQTVKQNEQSSEQPGMISPSGMYATLCSRAIELGDGITGVIPMFDMINHSSKPNLALTFDGENFELFATRDIKADEELFLSYTPIEEDKDDHEDIDVSSSTASWDEDEAVWCLVQWGIPTPKP